MSLWACASETPDRASTCTRPSIRREYLAAIFCGDFRVIKAIGGRMLDGQELAGIGIVLDIAVGFDQKRVARDKAATPAGHVEVLLVEWSSTATSLAPGMARKLSGFPSKTSAA